MSRGPHHRYNPTGERSFRGYPPRYGEFSGSSTYGYYGGPPYKRQRRLSDDDINPPPVNFVPAYYDPPYVRHQEVGLGEFNDFSSVSVEKDLKIHKRDGNRKGYERSEIHGSNPQSSTESSGHSPQHQRTSISSSPPSTKLSPHHSPRGRPSPPPPSSTAAPQPLLITTSQPSLSSSKVLLSSSSDESSVTIGKHHPLQIVCPTPQSVPSYCPTMQDKLKDGRGRPSTLSSLSPSGVLHKKDATYSGPTVEAISPSAPGLDAHVDKDDGEKKPVMDEPADIMSKDELLQGMEKVDREIALVIQQINNFKKMQKQLEDEASKEPDEPQKEEPVAPEPEPKSIIQIIYDDNRKKAEAAQVRLAKLGVPLLGGKPLYNQPSDLLCYHENLQRAPAIKAKLVKYFQLRKQAKEVKNRQLCKEYKTLKQAWLNKMERHENNPKRKHKEAKWREFYEKVFPEIKKQREQTERFTRMGSRSNWGIVARSEAEFNEIVDNLNEQEANERHMRTLAVEPPPLLDEEERRVKFINRNGLIRDPLAILNESKHKNIWTDKERRIFKDKFIHNPKDFDLISSFLPGKSVADTILFYYQTKKKEHYKQLSRRHNLKKRRRDQFGAGAPTSKTRVGTTESSAKGDRGGSEGEDDLEELTDSAEESEENEEPTQPPVTTTHATTSTPSARKSDHVETSRWSEKEIEIALQGLKDYGRDWEAIARRVMTKTGAQCKNFYFNYKKKLQLELLVLEHERTKIQRSQQQQQQQQRAPPLQHQPQQREISDKGDSISKQSLVAQASDSYTSGPSNQKSVTTTHSSPSDVCASISTTGTINTSERPTGNSSTVPATNSSTSIQLGSARMMPSHSALTSSSSTLFMPTPGVIASIGRASPNVGPAQPGQLFYRSSLPEPKNNDSLHSSRSPYPEAIFPSPVFPRAVDPSRPRPEILVSSRAGNALSESHPLYQTSSVHKVHSHSTSFQPSLSTNTQSTKGMLQLGSSHSMVSHPGSHVSTSHPVSHVIAAHHPVSKCVTSPPGSFSRTSDSHSDKPHSGESYIRSFHPSEPGNAPSGSIVLTSSGSSSNAQTQRSRPSSHSPVIVAPQDKPHNQVSFLEDASGGDLSLYKPTYLSTCTGSIRGESAGRCIKSVVGRKDMSPEPDVIVIDADEHRKIGQPRVEAAEGNQASSMLRRLASTGNATLAEQMPTSIEPVRPQSLPLSSGMYFTESRIKQSATPPGCSSVARPAARNPPPPLIQMSSSRDKKYTGAQDLTKESSRPREGFVHTKPYPERYLQSGHATSSGGDIPLHSHTREENRGSETERRTPVIETVDLTRDREGSTSSRTRPASGSHNVASSVSSARDKLQAMAKCAETNETDFSEKVVQKKREDTYLPPRKPDPKLGVYERSEAIRKFTALGNVCVSASREFPAGGDYTTQPYALMAMQTQHQQHVHPHSVGTSSPPPYAYPFHVGHPMPGFHRHPEHHFLVPVGVHQILSHSMNGEDLPGHLKVGGAFAHQYPQAPGYFSGIRSLLPTYPSMTVYGHPYPVPFGEERHPPHRPHEILARRPNDISEKDLANPFVVKQPRHTHSPGMSERIASPGEVSMFPLTSHSSAEPTKRPSTFSPEVKPQVAVQAEVGKTVSPPGGSYLSQIPSKPASVSEMRDRAAVIPELQDTTAVSQSFPHPQPVLFPGSKDSSRENRLIEQTSDDKETSAKKEHARDHEGSSLIEAIPMSAFATLVDVAAAARKVDIPFSAKEKPGSPLGVDENSRRKETTELQETSSSCQARLVDLSMASPTHVSSPPRTSPGISSTPRYGITTGLVPKPPPLMPITGVRPMQEGSCATFTPLSVSLGGHGNVLAARSPGKLTSPPGTRSRRSISPDGPPPLIPRSVISPPGLPQGTSPKVPPPLIRGMVSPVSTTLRSPESHVDSTMKTTFNQDGTPRQRPPQTSSLSDDAFQKGVSTINQDFDQKVSFNRPISLPTSPQRVNNDDATRLCFPGHSKVRTIVDARVFLDSVRDEMTRHHQEALPPPTSFLSEECPEMPSSSSTVVAETKTSTASGLLSHTQPEQTNFVSNHSKEVREMVQERWQVNQVYSTKKAILTNAVSPEAAIAQVSDSETEEGDEGEPDTEDDVPMVHSSSGGLHPRVRALVKRSQSNPRPSYYDASDSETLSAEESEALPESSDELFPGSIMKQLSQPDNSCETRGNGDQDFAERDSTISTDTSFAVINVPILSESGEYPDDGVVDTRMPHMQSENFVKRHGLEDPVTSSGPIFRDLTELKFQKPTEDSPTTSTIPDDTRNQMDRRDAGEEEEKEPDTSLGQEPSEDSDQELIPSQSSSSGEAVVEQDTSEALPAQANRGLYEDDAVRVQSSGDILVESSGTGLAAAALQVVSSLCPPSPDIPDSSDNIQQIPGNSEASLMEKSIDTHNQNASENAALVALNGTNAMISSLSVTDMEDNTSVKVSDTGEDNACQSTSEAKREHKVSAVLDQEQNEYEGINEADPLEKPDADHSLLQEADSYSSVSENHPPEISSAIDDAFDESEHLAYPTFIEEFVPPPGTVDSPHIRSRYSNTTTSEESSVCDDSMSEREVKEVFELAPSNQEDISVMLNAGERIHHPDNTLSEGEIPPSQESTPTDDELKSVGNKFVNNEVTAVVTDTVTEKLQSAWHCESSQTVTINDRLPSQGKESIDDQLSEGEILESDDEPAVDTSVLPVISSSCEDSNMTRVATRHTSMVCTSQEDTSQADCYINMIPISPAPPSQESESNHALPLPSWPPGDSQYSSVVSLSMATRITPFPYSTLSINVGSASSSARSSPVPQALAVSLAPGSSPNSSSLLPRPQESTPLLSDNYEPLSDDDDDEMADASNISDVKENV